MKHDATQAYFTRDYAKVHKLCAQLSAWIDAYLKNPAGTAN
jgi:hypothetical protein